MVSRQAWPRCIRGFIPEASTRTYDVRIVGIHTLNFEPYRVDLAPFAALLGNGRPHSVAVSVYNANGYFSATATLLLSISTRDRSR